MKNKELTLREILTTDKKIRRKGWPDNEYIQWSLSEDMFLTEKCKPFPIDGIDSYPTDWYFYDENPEKKKYWLWRVCQPDGMDEFNYWATYNAYADEQGFLTSGKQIPDWDEFLKEKLEHTMIEV